MRPEQLEQALDLQRKGWTHERIAKQLKVTRVTVSRALAKHNRRAFALLAKQTEAEKARQVAVLEWAIEQASDGWERSARDAEKMTETTTSEDSLTAAHSNGGGLKSSTKSSLSIEGQAGDPRFLRVLAQALADIRKILGLDARPDDKPAAFSLADLTAAAEAAAAAHRAAERPADRSEPES